MGRAAYLAVVEAHSRLALQSRACGPASACSASSSRALSRWPARPTPPRAPTRRSRPSSPARCRRPGVSRSSAIAVELGTGRVRLRTQSVAAADPGLEREARRDVRRARLARARLPDRDAGARAGRAGRRPSGTATSCSRAPATRRSSSLGLRRLAAEVRGAGIRSSPGGSSVTSPTSTPSGSGPGWKPHFFINESPPLSALTVDRGRYLGRTSRAPALRGRVPVPQGALRGRRARRRPGPAGR